MKSPDRDLVVIPGFTGSVGAAYARALEDREGTDVVGLSRRTNSEPVFPAMQVIDGVDLLDLDSVQAAIRRLRLGSYDHCTLIHPVGTFKWEESPPPPGQVDSEVYRSNVVTFGNVFYALLRALQASFDGRLEAAGLTAVMFGSVADRYKVPHWRSYTTANDDTEEMIRCAAIIFGQQVPIRGIRCDLGTIDVASERHLRPHADRRYWLKVDDLAARSLPVILPVSDGPAITGSTFERVQIFEPKPGFDPDRYFTDPRAIEAVWHREMGVDHVAAPSLAVGI